MSLSLPSFDFSPGKTVIALIAVLMLASLDLHERVRNRQSQLLFACVLGSLLSVGFIKFTRAILVPGVQDNAFAMALGVLLILVAWRLLFGPWEVQTKATVLGSFVFWVALHLLWREDASLRIAHAMAIAVALIPAVVWCMLFLGYHRERVSTVLLMFFAGMLATAPILFYDALVRRGVELHFFLFRIVPESFGRTTENFVTGQFGVTEQVPRTILVTFLSFVIVGFIEELSKYWVLKKSGQRLFSSIDDVMQFAIIVAIGFAFAENIANQGYFLSFVREYLVNPETKDLSAFFGNVMGRSILTSMVHIVSTGILGYFLGLSIFAGPYLQEAESRGKQHRVVEYIHGLLRIQKKSIFQTQMIIIGLLVAIVLHAFSNFMVTLSDILPGNPRTIGDLLHSPQGSLFHYVSILLFPALLYVVGGFWLLTELFAKKQNMKEHGRLISTDAFVTTEEQR